MRGVSRVLLFMLGFVAACLDPSEPGNLVAKTVVEDPALPRIEIDGTLLHAETFGNPANPVVLVLHGGPGGDYRSMLPLQALSDDGYYVVYWDQRGSGLSQRHDADVYSFSIILEDLKEVIDHYTQDASRPMVFVAHSWGAMYATWFINEYGDYGGRISGAVLSEPPAFTKTQLDAYAARYGASLNYFGKSLMDIGWLGPFMSPADQARADYLVMVQEAAGVPALHADPSNRPPEFRAGAVAGAAMQALVDRDGFDWTGNLGSFAPMVLFLRGDLNEATRLEDQQEMASKYPSAEIVTISHVGHFMIWEKPSEYLENVRSYFQTIGFAGGTP